MDKKKLFIYGACGLGGYIVVNRIASSRAAANQAAVDASQSSADNSSLLGYSPVSAGFSSLGSGGSTGVDTSTAGDTTTGAPSTASASNALTADQLMQIFTASNQHALAVNQQNTSAAVNMNDTNSLSLMSLVNSLMPGGSVSVNHTATGTTISSGASQGSDALSQAYEQYLGRAPDASGYSFYAGQVSSGAMSIPGAIASIQNSPEATVDRAYEQALGRPPDAGGLAYFMGQLGQGMTADQLTATLASSQEAQAKKAA